MNLVIDIPFNYIISREQKTTMIGINSTLFT